MVNTRASAAWLRRFAGTTPGVVAVVAILVGLICVIAGVVSGGQLDARIAKQTSVLDRSEPFANAAQNLYAALSAADAAAASAFLAAEETGPLRVRYQQALADASAALTDVTAGVSDTETRTKAAELSAQLSAYTGLVEAARANSRQGFPVGSAYLNEASALMQTTMLPSAAEIFERNLATVEAEQEAIGSLPLASLVLLLLAFVAIVVASIVVSRRTNRTFNLGLVVAAVLTVVVGLWMVIATQLAAGSAERSRIEGTERFKVLADARIIAAQARTNETLQLITRGDITKSEEKFDEQLDQLDFQLGDSPDARAAVEAWVAGHDKQVDAYRAGDFGAAVEQSIGADPNSSAGLFANVETSLRGELENARDTLRDRVSTAGAWLTFSPTGTLILMVLAAAAAFIGLWPRLKEFL